jgi:hypothetical protein
MFFHHFSQNLMYFPCTYSYQFSASAYHYLYCNLYLFYCKFLPPPHLSAVNLFHARTVSTHCKYLEMSVLYYPAAIICFMVILQAGAALAACSHNAKMQGALQFRMRDASRSRFLVRASRIARVP